MSVRRPARWPLLAGLVILATLTISCAPAAPPARPLLPRTAAAVAAEPASDADPVTDEPEATTASGSGLDAAVAASLAGEENLSATRLGVLDPYRARLAPPDRLVIPAIQLDSRVVPIGIRPNRLGSPVWQTAAFAVGFHQGSASPGEIGNVVLSGHISSPNEGAVFRRLPQVKVDDGIAVFTAQESFLYRVRDIKVVLPSAVEVLDSTDRAILTLITCVPDGVYSHRLIVQAEAV